MELVHGCKTSSGDQTFALVCRCVFVHMHVRWFVCWFVLSQKMVIISRERGVECKTLKGSRFTILSCIFNVIAGS